MGEMGRLTAGVIVAILIGGLIGAGLGYRLGTNAVVSNWTNTNAEQAVEVVEVLENFRANDHQNALALLETHLNRHVFGLMPAARGGVSLPEESLDRIANAAATAKAYRDNYPHAGETALDQDIRHFLDDL